MIADHDVHFQQYLLTPPLSMVHASSSSVAKTALEPPPGSGYYPALFAGERLEPCGFAAVAGRVWPWR